MNYDDTDEKDVHGLTDSALLDVVGDEHVSDDEEAEDGSAFTNEADEADKW